MYIYKQYLNILYFTNMFGQNSIGIKRNAGIENMIFKNKHENFTSVWLVKVHDLIGN